MPPAGSVPDRLRLFFALVPDERVRESLARLALELTGRSRGRAVAPANLHLTLAFLGETPAAEVPRLCGIGDALPGDGFTLVLDHVGSFRGTGIAWVGARDTPPALEALQRALTAALSSNGFPIESRPFRAHVTVARKGSIPVRDSLPEPVEWVVHTMALVASTPAPGGSVYRSLATWPLGAADVQPATGTV